MKILTVMLTPALALSLTACAMTQATIDPNSERSVTRSFRDISSARAIKARMLRIQGFDLNDISVDVDQGIVVLAGAAPRAEDKVEAERIAWSAPGVNQVGNEIRIGASANLFSKTKDDLIATSVRTKLAASNNVRNLNYQIETRDGIVYLMGVARSEDELAEAARLASITRGVTEVVSYATIKGDMPNAFYDGGSTSNIASAPAAEDLSFWGEPVTGDSATIPYTPPNSGNYDNSNLIDNTAPLPYRPGITELDPDALDSGEAYLRDPATGQRIILPDGVEPIPYVPDQGPGSLGAGGAPLPPGAQPSKTLGTASTEQFAGGTTVTLSDSYTMDAQGNQIPVRWDGNQWVELIR